MSSPFQQFFLRITADAPPAPDPEMYLPHPALADLSDCSVTVDGILLPLHSQILSAQAALLHGLFASRMEGMSAGEAIPDISRAFEGGSTLEVVCLLRLLYNAHEAHPHTFTGLSAAGLLAGIARLAHRLDAASLLRSLHSFLLGLAPRHKELSMPHLLTAVQASTVCKLDAILDTFLDAVAGRLAGTGGQAKLLSLPVLQSLDAHILAQLLVKTLQRVPGSACDMTSILDAVVNPDGTALGFTASLAPPSSFGIQRSSSVDIDGIRWELAAWPGRSHLTVKLSFEAKHALTSRGIKSITVLCVATAIDQRTASTSTGICGIRHEKAGRLSLECNSLAWPDFMSLEQLRSTQHGFLQQGRLQIRADIHLTDVELA